MPPAVLRRWSALVGLCLLAAAAVRAAETPTAEWRIETRQGADGIPVSKLDLVLNGRHVVALRAADELGDYRVIPRADFARHKIPAKALCACQSHVVNSGVYYYVTAAGKDAFVLYGQSEDVDGRTGFKKVRTITVRTRTRVTSAPGDPASIPY